MNTVCALGVLTQDSFPAISRSGYLCISYCNESYVIHGAVPLGSSDFVVTQIFGKNVSYHGSLLLD